MGRHRTTNSRASNRYGATTLLPSAEKEEDFDKTAIGRHRTTNSRASNRYGATTLLPSAEKEEDKEADFDRTAMGRHITMNSIQLAVPGSKDNDKTRDWAEFPPHYYDIYYNLYKTESGEWFARKPASKKDKRPIFIGVKVNDVFGVDDEEETFYIFFQMYLNWVPTKEEFEECKAFEKKQKELKKQRKLNFEPEPDEVHTWIPDIKPNFEIRNARDVEIIQEKFKLKTFKDVAVMSKDMTADKIWFIRTKIIFKLQINEEYEMQNYPFDCQDLTTILVDNSKSFVFYPEFRERNFCVVTRKCIEIGEFSMKAAFLDVGDISVGDRVTREKTAIILSLKMQRRWYDILLNQPLIIMLLSLMSLAIFSIPVESYVDRFNLVLTLILTAVASSIKTKSKPYFTLLDKYMLVSFLYLVATTIMVAIIRDEVDQKQDEYIRYTWMIIFVLLQLIFIIYAFFKKRAEETKIFSNFEQICYMNGDEDVVEFDYFDFGVKKDKKTKKNKLFSYFGSLSLQTKKDEIVFENIYRNQRTLPKKK
eukprot:314014_1